MATIKGTSKKDKLRGTASKDTIFGLGADDRLYGKSGDDTLKGGAGNDKLYGDKGKDKLFGDKGNDKLYGGSGKDSLDGGAGNDTLDGGTDADKMKGGAGNDTFLVDNAGDTVSDSAGIDSVSSKVSYTLAAGNGIENLTLLGAALSGTGNELANTITGNALDNSLEGGAGADILAGGEGSDTYLIRAGDTAAGESIVDTGTAGFDTIKAVNSSGITLEFDLRSATLTGFEAVAIETAAGPVVDTAVRLNASQLPGTLSYIGGTGRNILIVDGIGTLDTSTWTLSGDTTSDIFDLRGTDGDNEITGNSLDDIIAGNGGIDTLKGGGGSDVLSGGADSDNLYGDAGIDILDGGTGNDTLDGGTDNDTLNGGNGNDLLTGQTGEDVLNGGENDDSLNGGADNDTLNGGNGNDLLVVSTGVDILNGDGGNDTLSLANATIGLGDLTFALDASGAASGVDATSFGLGVFSYSSIENITGRNLSGVNDFLIGNAGDNVITGLLGNNFMEGGAGNDTLVGGAETDTMSFFTSSGVTFELAALGAAIDVLISVELGTDSYSSIENLDGSATGVDVLSGNEAANLIRGFGGDDIIDGRGGNDTIEGGNGNDTLNGNGDDDNLYGGAGDDKFVFQAGFFSPTIGFDTVYDFQKVAGSAGDQIQLGSLGFFGAWNVSGSGTSTVFTALDFGNPVGSVTVLNTAVAGVTQLVSGDDYVFI